MFEVEIKTRTEHGRLLNELEKSGAAYEKTVHQVDTYYNAPHRDFGETDEALRIREQNGRVFMTYKGKKIDAVSKTRKEVEVEIGDRNRMEDILTSLGFKKTLEVRKDRDIYHLNGAEICLDCVDGLGCFVELEVQAKDSSDIEEKRDELIKLMRGLGITEELIRESYLEMLLKKST